MHDEGGFTLTEMTAALLVLSVGLISLGEITNILFRSWTHTQTQHQHVRAATTLVDEMPSAEQYLKSASDERHPLVIETDDGQILTLAVPKLDRTSDCEYDLVGRRCRQ